MNNTPLPEPWDYCYEWDGPFGTRKFSTASHNGSRPDRSVPIYTPDQMHAHAAAVSAERDAEIANLKTVMVAAAEQLKTRTIRLNDADFAKLKAIGMDRLRAWINRTKVK